ncbi:MAG TPA: Uma2 family endonuclease [Blastocatellia bacterium]|nr:Uma2 family endonuclease [Blastocatellia bacterium]
MSTAISQDVIPFVVKLGPLMKQISEDDFFDFCLLNPDLDIERTSDGEVIIMPPTGGETGHSNFSLTVDFGIWARKDGTGIGFDSSTNFVLPNGAVRGPDLSWVKRERWEKLTPEQRRKFPPLCPDFVVELRSPSDSLKALQEKMQEYLENGAQLGWLIDPIQKKVYVYRPGVDEECLDNPASVSGEPLLPGFTLSLSNIW